jgi:hypothetical protein
MFTFFGKEYGYNELRERTGNISHIAGVRRFTYSEGRAKGTEAIEIRNGAGLTFTVLPDRCMDLGLAEYRGIPLSWNSNTGVTSPSYYESWGNEWLRGFGGGLLTTCGFTTLGPPSSTDGEEFGLHGRASNLVAEKVCADESFVNGEYVITVSGKIRQAKALVENLLLTRKITVRAGKNLIRVEDTIENAGYSRQPFMILYHCNFGFPLVNEKAVIYVPNDGITPRFPDMPTAEQDIKEYGNIIPPQDVYDERVFLFKAKKGNDGRSRAIITADRDKKELAVQLSWNTDVLDNFALWKQMAKGDYVIGLEPCNNQIQGQIKAKEEGKLKYLEPGEKKRTCLEFEILSGKTV